MRLNDWQEGRQHQLIINRSLKKIRMEIQYNRHSLEKVMPYHRTCRLSLNSTCARGNDFLSIWKGLNPPMLNNSAFESARILQAVALMDYDLSSGISQLYAQQDFFYDMVSMYARMLIGNGTAFQSFNNSPNYHMLVPIFSDITAAEQNLLTLYDISLTKIDSIMYRRGVISFLH